MEMIFSEAQPCRELGYLAVQVTKKKKQVEIAALRSQ
jgi:hypothetical protein